MSSQLFWFEISWFIYIFLVKRKLCSINYAKKPNTVFPIFITHYLLFTHILKSLPMTHPQIPSHDTSHKGDEVFEQVYIFIEEHIDFP